MNKIDSRYAELFLCVDSRTLNLEKLTTLIGIAGDQCWNQGDQRGGAKSQKTYAFSRWSITEYALEPHDFDEQLSTLFSRVQPLIATLGLLPNECRVALSMCLNESNTVFGWGLSSEHVAILSAINGEIDVSFAVD